MPEELTLRLPRLEEEQEFLLAHRATTPEQPSFLHDYEEGISFARYLELLDARAASAWCRTRSQRPSCSPSSGAGSWGASRFGID